MIMALPRTSTGEIGVDRLPVNHLNHSKPKSLISRIFQGPSLKEMKKRLHELQENKKKQTSKAGSFKATSKFIKEGRYSKEKLSKAARDSGLSSEVIKKIEEAYDLTVESTENG